jgi:hypothetical protein
LSSLLGQLFSGRWTPPGTTSSTGLISAFVTVTDALRAVTTAAVVSCHGDLHSNTDPGRYSGSLKPGCHSLLSMLAPCISRESTYQGRHASLTGRGAGGISISTISL